MNVLYVDIETRCLHEEVGGWDNLRKGAGGISAIVIHDDNDSIDYLYDDHTIEQAAEHLEKGDVVVTFNGKSFDIPCMEGVLGRKILIKYHFDLQQVVRKSLKLPTDQHRGIRLGDLVHRTLGLEKNGEGKSAPTLARQGRFAELFSYCRNDVSIMRHLTTFARTEGFVIGANGDPIYLNIPEWFKSKRI